MSKNIQSPNRKSFTLFLITVLLAGVALIVSPVHAATITVNSTLDVIADDGQCTLREAITAANADTASGSSPGECPAGSGADTINLPAGTYTLTIPPHSEQNNAGGDLDIRSDITINGSGAGSTIIQAGTTNANGIDRVLHVVGSSDKLTLNDVTVRYGSRTGGGIYNTGTLTIDNSVISNNSGTGGGGIYNNEGTLTINNSTLSNSSAGTDGGGVYNNQGVVTVQNSIISGNSAGRWGGGVHNVTGRLTIENSTIADNSAVENGGGFTNNDGWVTINHSTISGNSTDGRGGGVFSGGDTTIINSTISVNSADGSGGGVYGNDSTMNLVHCTITYNNGKLGGGGIYRNGSAIEIKNSIVAGNTANIVSTANDDCEDLTTSQGYNLFGMGSGCPSGGTGDQITSDAKLDALADNGGLTETHALQSGSPALDVIPDGISGCGSNYTDDQRSVPRPLGGSCDVGAYEAGGAIWDNGGGDSNWSTDANWSGDTVPTASSAVIFNDTSDADASMDTSFTVASVFIDTDYDGAVNSGSHDLTVNGDYNQSGGAFTAPAGLMSVGGGFHHSNGSFDPNGGRVVLDNTSDQTLATTTTFNDLVLNDGLLGYWKLDEGSGTIAADSSGYGHDGTLHNSPAWGTDTPSTMGFYDPYALGFNRTDSVEYVTMSGTTQIDQAQELTLSTWVRLDSAPTEAGTTNMRFITLGNEKAVLRYHDDSGTNHMHFYMSIGGSLRGIVVDHPWATDTWYHVAGTYDGSTMRLYLDGVEVGTKTFSGTADAGDGIRLSHSANEEALDGLLDDVRIYNRALSAGKILALAAGEHPETSIATTSLVSALDVNGDLTLNSGTLDVSPAQAGYWKFDEESGATAGDSSGNGNDGTLNGDPIWTTTAAPTNFNNSHALDFDGSGDYVAINGVADDVSGDVAIAFWVKAPSGSVSRTLVAVNRANKSNVVQLSLRDDDAYWVYDAGSLAWEGDTNTVVADGTWHHLAYTSDGTTGRLYVDGVQKSTHTPNYTFSNVDLWSLAQDWDSGGPSKFLVGSLDDVRIYDHMLSADDIQTLAGGDEVYKSINLAGDSTRNGGVFEPGGGSVTFDGSGTQTLDSDNIAFYDLTVNSGATLDLGDKTVLTVDGTLANNGSLKQTKEVNGSQTAFLNIKDSGGVDRYQGVEIDPGAGDMGSTAVTVSGNQLCSTAIRGVLRCFELESTSPQTALVRFYYTEAERNGQVNPTMNIYHWNEAGSAWDPEVGTYARGGIDDGQWVQVTEIDEYSSFALANQGPIVPPVAGFEADPTKGVAPLTVTFTNTTSGGYSTSLWDFGDGQTSAEQHPTHVYTITGTYTVSLDVSGLDGSDTLTRTNYITATVPAPAAAFTGDPTNGAISLEVQFSDESTGDIDTWLWQFGDGDTSADPHPTHIYSSGAYTVSLEVSGPGGSDTLTRTNYITVTEPAPVAAFSSDLTEGPAPLEVQFSDESTGTINTWLWQFGDGDTSADPHPTHIYSSGTYTVSLEVSGLGGSDTLTRTNYITATVPAPAAAFTGDPTIGIAPLQVQFSDESAGVIETWLWQFGNGDTSAEQHPTHVYTSAGVYTVSLTVDGPDGSDTLTRTNYITVTEPAMYKVYLPLVIRGQGGID